MSDSSSDNGRYRCEKCALGAWDCACMRNPYMNDDNLSHCDVPEIKNPVWGSANTDPETEKLSESALKELVELRRAWGEPSEGHIPTGGPSVEASIAADPRVRSEYSIGTTTSGGSSLFELKKDACEQNEAIEHSAKRAGMLDNIKMAFRTTTAVFASCFGKE